MIGKNATVANISFGYELAVGAEVTLNPSKIQYQYAVSS